MGELRYELKQQIDGVKESIKDIEKLLKNAWAASEDVQQESKAYKDSKRSHQEMLDKQTNLIQYCAKVMQTIINEYRTLFLRFIADISGKRRTDWQTLKR